MSFNINIVQYIKTGKNMQLKALKNYKEHNITLDSLPLVIHLESVKGCPFDCSMCHYGNTKTVDLPDSLLKKLEPYYSALEVLTIHGEGEPLVSNNLGYFVKKSNEHKFVLHMNTTGALLTDEKIEVLSKAYGLSIRFSIHAGTPETYKKIMGVDLESVLSKIKKLVDLSVGKNHDFWLSYIVMKENINEIEDFLKLAKKCNVKSVRFMNLYPTVETIKGVTKREFKFKHFEQFNPNIIAQFTEDLPSYELLATELGITIEYGAINQVEKSYSHMLGDLTNKVTNRLIKKRLLPIIPNKGSCVIPWYGQLSITIDGDVKICANSSYHIGNLYDNNLEEIWNVSKMKELRTAFKQGHYHKLCGYCKGFDIDNLPKNSFKEIRKMNTV